jgi:hypothetical protein
MLTTSASGEDYQTVVDAGLSIEKSDRFWCKRQERGIFGVSTPLDEAGAHAEH